MSGTNWKVAIGEEYVKKLLLTSMANPTMFSFPTTVVKYYSN